MSSRDQTDGSSIASDLTQERSRAPETGPKVIARILKTLPSSPGVYRMIGNDREVLYVGKARNLKKRVQSYARLGGHTNRIARMISATAAMEFVTTKTEIEALLLEANLIKRLKPRFNVILRDDKSFPYILIAHDHAAPQILKHRGARKRKGDYFGPFASAGAVNRTINTLQRAFLLRSCTDSYYESRTRPCLLFQIKRCSAPCTGEIGHEGYAALVEEARGFLKGKSDRVKAQLHVLMDEASEKLEFERAASYRDRLAALSHVQSHQGINPRIVVEADVFAAHQDAGQTCVQVFFFRTGQNWGNRAYFPRADKSLPVGEVLDSFIAQFYDDKPCPRLILLSHDIPGRQLLGEALSTRAGRKVAVMVPQRGEKKELVTHALANAREALARRLAESSSQRKLLEGLSRVFDLDDAPRRIEVYDNSHIQGSKPVGAMIVAGHEGFQKTHYRKFNIKSEELAPGDDYGMMREVLMRRFSRLLKEAEPEVRPDGSGSGASEDELPAWPDLLLIDGGAGQLSSVHEVLDELGITSLCVVAIAKGPDRNAGRERFFMRGRQPFMLEPRDPVLYFVQRLRDEAHRFAIGSHRARRKKAIGASPLDEVPGVGPARKRALLKHFGSAKAVSRAGVADLRAVEGISALMAQNIYDFFHEQNA
ncbi:MAG: excinuclease ABC subunit UvrC [Methyloligellaceae bacterium]